MLLFWRDAHMHSKGNNALRSHSLFLNFPWIYPVRRNCHCHGHHILVNPQYINHIDLCILEWSWPDWPCMLIHYHTKLPFLYPKPTTKNCLLYYTKNYIHCLTHGSINKENETNALISKVNYIHCMMFKTHACIGT